MAAAIPSPQATLDAAVDTINRLNIVAKPGGGQWTAEELYNRWGLSKEDLASLEDDKTMANLFELCLSQDKLYHLPRA